MSGKEQTQVSRSYLNLRSDSWMGGSLMQVKRNFMQATETGSGSLWLQASSVAWTFWRVVSSLNGKGRRGIMSTAELRLVFVHEASSRVGINTIIKCFFPYDSLVC